jgi:hypothetical protein
MFAVAKPLLALFSGGLLRFDVARRFASPALITHGDISNPWRRVSLKLFSVTILKPPTLR